MKGKKNSEQKCNSGNYCLLYEHVFLSQEQRCEGQAQPVQEDKNNTKTLLWLEI